LDKPDVSGFVTGVVVPVLGVITLTLFLQGLLCPCYWLGREGSPCKGSGCWWAWSGRRWACSMAWTGRYRSGGSCYLLA
jgi:hypothetical protein